MKMRKKIRERDRHTGIYKKKDKKRQRNKKKSKEREINFAQVSAL